MNKKEALRYITETFHEFQIPYALIGAFAVAVWGITRATQDIDFLADIPSDKITSVLKSLQSRGFETELRPGDIEDPIRGNIKLTYRSKEDEESIDILLGIEGLPREIYKKTSNISILDVTIPVISPEDLIITKLLAGSPVDIDDAGKILKVMKGQLNLDYLNKFCKEKRLQLPGT